MNKKLWTNAELDLFGSDMTDEQIAHSENMGRSIASLYQRASELKLTRPHRKVNHGNQY